MKVMVTGGSGMVGRNILEHPAADRYAILAPDRTVLDLLDRAAVQRFLERHRPDVIIHAAGKVGGIQANIVDPLGFLLENLEMGSNLLQAARAAGIPRVINLGSSCMYPRDRETPLREEQILTGTLEPTNEGYALAKIVVARLGEYLERMPGGPQVKTLIPCNLYGRWDEFDPARSHLVPSVIRKLHEAKVAGSAEVEIWGDGSARREFMYAGDLADCLWRAVAEFDTLPEVMNVGIGEDHTVNEYYRVTARVVGYAGTFRHDLDMPVGMSRKLVDTGRLERWGWRAKMSLEEGLAAAYAFFLEHESRL